MPPSDRGWFPRTEPAAGSASAAASAPRHNPLPAPAPGDRWVGSASGPLQPPELATAAVLGGLTVALTLIGWFIPHASAVGVLAVLPMAVVANRYRTRAVVASTVAAMAASFLVAGTGPLPAVVSCAAIGGLVGKGRRQKWSYLRTMLLATFVVGPAFALFVDGSFVAFSALRKLTLEQLGNVYRGLANLVGRIPHLGGLARSTDHDVNVALRLWWITLPVILILYAFGVASLTWQIMAGVLQRLELVPAPDLLDPDKRAMVAAGTAASDEQTPDPGPAEVIAPVPAEVSSVSYRYDGATEGALNDVSLRVSPGRLLAVLGNNGSGKSTLIRLLAGRSPTAGTIDRPGAVGLGLTGGTAVVSQRPETQVLGVRVADDLVWGLPPGTPVDVAELLHAVGLGGMEERETATLSGGELQRVAMAAALAHRPRLLLSDESTAMVDPEGRKALTDLLAKLPSTTGMAVVHVTHRPEEAAVADAAVRLDRGRVVTAPALTRPAAIAPALARAGLPEPAAIAPAPTRPAAMAPAVARAGLTEPAFPGLAAGRASQTARRFTPARAVFRLTDVSHTYGERTAWAHPALFEVSFDVERGDGLLVVGGNGSGKSTLAWIMAGLLRPTSGMCLLDGAPVRARTRQVSLAFQHARLQLQRETVLADVRHAAGVDSGAAEAALRAVGLEPGEVGERPIDQLSGGQMRRVALAGLLASTPRVLILDEPLAGLDLPTKESLCDRLAALRAAGLTLVVISHDLEGMEAVCDRVVRLEKGRAFEDSPGVERRPVRDRGQAAATLVRTGSSAPVGTGARDSVGTGSSDSVGTGARDSVGTGSSDSVGAGSAVPDGRATEGKVRHGGGRRRPVSVVFLRQVGGGTPIHRLWAGTKLIAVAVLSLILSYKASWPSTGLLAAVVLGAAVLARIPLRALPRLPVGFWLLMLFAAALTVVAGGSPYVNLIGIRVGFGDLDRFALFWFLSLVLLGASLMVGWTTSVADIAPAVVRLGRPLRVLKLPVDEWAITLALCVRSLPLLVDELRTLLAARRLRPLPTRADGTRDLLVEAVDLFTASLVVALRRADEMADAMRARGGTSTLSATVKGPTRRDAVALTVVLAACIAALLLP